MRVLLIKPSALGDVATTLPLLCDLKSAMPNAQIDWLIHPSNVPVIEGHDALHQIIPFDRKKLTSWYYKPSAFRLFRELLRTLRQNHYDAVIDAQGLLRSGFLTRYTGAKIRIGFASAREGARFAYTHKIQLPEKGLKMLAVDRMRALGKPLGTDISKFLWPSFIVYRFHSWLFIIGCSFMGHFKRFDVAYHFKEIRSRSCRKFSTVCCYIS